MTLVPVERRRLVDGGIICENRVLRLRVLPGSPSLRVTIEAVTPAGLWTPVADLPLWALFAAGDGAPSCATFFTYDPLELEGHTRGVALHGYLEDSFVTLSILFSADDCWCTCHLDIDAVPPEFAVFHTWRLLTQTAEVDLAWPPLDEHPLAAMPTAFVQAGHTLLAVIPVPSDEEGEPPFCGTASPGDVQVMSLAPLDGPAEARAVQLHYTLHIDAFAQPGSGFQQLVRHLGEDAILWWAYPSQSRTDTPLPVLPDRPAAQDWWPFTREGTLGDITALVREQFRRVDAGDWQFLDDGLLWLDRLCLQQQMSDDSLDRPFGTIAEPASPEASWLPVILMQAFRLTGRTEYLSRANAALHALPEELHGPVLGAIYARYGDVYIHTAYQVAACWTTDEVCVLAYAPNAVTLEAPLTPGKPLRVVIDGSDDAYTLIVNGVEHGTYAAETCAAGVPLPAPP